MNVRGRADSVGSNKSFDISRIARGISFHPSALSRPAGTLSDDSFDGIGVVREPSDKSFVRPRAAFPASDGWNDTVLPVGYKSYDSLGYSSSAWTTPMQSLARPGQALA